MSYYDDQMFDVTNKSEIITIINRNININININKTQIVLPDGFSFKTLGLKYLDEIHELLNNNYIEDDMQITRIIYSRDFLYWYLKNVPTNFAIGLIYNKKLIGFITALIIDTIIYNEKIRVPYINFLCIQKKLRGMNLAPLLIDEIKYRLIKNHITYALFCTKDNLESFFSFTTNYVIPINYEKLKKIGFLNSELDPLPVIDNNPLHLMVESDILSIVPKLNASMEKIKIKPYFTFDSAKNFLLPKKNIVYTFIKKNNKGEVTDFITVYKNYLYCIESDEMVSVGQLAFYYYETMDLTQLVTYLLNKLVIYKFDQLVFRDMNKNSDINITKFSTSDELYFYLYNVNIKQTLSSDVCWWPF